MKAMNGTWTPKDWTLDAGVLWTRGQIARHKLKDAAGTEHRPYGVMTWSARTYAHVCLDDHGDLGRQIHFFEMDALRWKAFTLLNAARPLYGTLPGSKVKNTGAGFQVMPRDDGIKIAPFDVRAGEISERAVRIVSNYLAAEGREHRGATRDEQLRGIDIVVLDGTGETIEVKARDRAFDRIFVQISETNPEKLRK